MQSLVSGTAAQLVKWVQPPQYHPLSHLALPLLLLLLLRLVNRLWDRVQLQLHHKSFSSSLQVASRCTCHMLPNVGYFPLFLSFQIKTQTPNRATRSEVQRLRCAFPSHTLSLSLACSQFLDLWLRFEYNYVVSKIFESSGKLRPCIFETSNRFEHI